ncbi:MAG TPA: hypothetical protein HPP87_07840 [Planctomycetes bacterium]|nr:hypothetical protein [Planctomycetota bacterium]HIJ71259.1 hypothetical protein [Planctomycetota bacterium]
MEKAVALLKNSVKEYEILVGEISSNEGAEKNVDWFSVEAKLQSEADWTINGARCLVQLVQDYGSFILRNALALALAANVEDGELNF